MSINPTLSIISNTYPNDYTFTRDGEGVDIYIIDDGVRLSHEQFSELQKETLYSFDGNDFGDISGVIGAGTHGTKVASAMCGKSVGIARKAKLYNCRFRYDNTTLIEAFDAIYNHHISKGNDRPSVVNMSFSYNVNPSFLESLINKLYDVGIVMCTAMGNFGEVTMRYPAAYSKTIASGNMMKRGTSLIQYVPADNSNYGEWMDVWTAGENSNVASIVSDSSYSEAGGTSISSGYTSALCALILQGSNKPQSGVDVESIRSVLIETSLKDLLNYDFTFSDDRYLNSNTPNRWAFNGFVNEPFNFSAITTPEPEPTPDPTPDPEPTPPFIPSFSTQKIAFFTQL